MQEIIMEDSNMKEENEGMICRWYYTSKNNRKNDLESGLGDDGTYHYEKTGCYTCNGFNDLCRAYLVPEAKVKKMNLKYIIYRK